jgi:AraC-like DNA-binding protein
MEYAEFTPTPSLRGMIRCYWVLRGEPGDAGTADPALPDGSPELIFNLADPFEHIAADGAVTRQPRQFLVGQITRPIAVRPTGRVRLVAVRFEAHGAAMLHDDLQRLTDRWIDAGELRDGVLRDVAPALAAATTPEREVAVLDASFAGFVRVLARPDARVAAAVRRIRDTHGSARLDALAVELALTPRTLQRLFAKQVGISPKLLARIVRFQRVFAASRDGAGALARVAIECGYSDQSHLVRDFRDFAGAPPAALLAALPEFTAFFTAGPQRPGAAT